MAWFKKSEDGDSDMMNSNSNGRPTPPESAVSRPEPRDPRVEPRAEARAPMARPAETRSTERPPEARAADPRAAEGRAAEVRAAEAAPRASVLGPTLKFRGELSAQEDLIIQGSVEGSITHTQSLTVGTDGTMKGDIRARVIIVDGKVEGDLYATESVNIRATAKVKGNVFAPRVGITEGAFFQGQVEMQPSGAAVQEHSARLRQAAQAMPSQSAPLQSAPSQSAPLQGTPSIDAPAVDRIMSAS
jgi:cytoskeletal protein CcmA (bactofilin family)